MEREFITHHIKEDSGLEHLIASMQPKKYSKVTFGAKFKGLEGGFRSTLKAALLNYEKLRVLSDPGP